MTIPATGSVFISYRREDTSHLAGRLYDRLAARFGDANVFMDVDTLDPGVDFAEAITQAVGACEVLIAVIGPGWLVSTDESGSRRLDDPDDLVRLEVEAALIRGIRVIPVLTERAVMPARTDLPERLAGLTRRHALSIRHESFNADSARLLIAIEQVLGARKAEAPASEHVLGARKAEAPASEKRPSQQRENVLKTMREIISAEFGVDASRVTGDTRLRDLDVDSLDLVEGLLALEEKFGIEISDEEAVNVRTVGEVADLVISKRL